MEFYYAISRKNKWQNNSIEFYGNLPSLASSITLLCRDKLMTMFPEFVTAFSIPDVEPIEMSPLLTLTSLSPERGKMHFINKYMG